MTQKKNNGLSSWDNRQLATLSTEFRLGYSDSDYCFPNMVRDNK